MDRSIRAMFPDDDHVLGPFLGNLPPEILDAVVQKLGWFRTTFAMAGRTCREVVARVPSMRAVLTEEELERLGSREVRLTPLAVAVLQGDVEAMVWLMQLFDEKCLEWRNVSGTELSLLAAERGKIESLTCLRANGCPWDEGTCAHAAYEGHLEVLQWARQNGCPWDRGTCSGAAYGGHLEVLKWARQNGCPWDWRTCANAAYEGHLEVLQWARQNGCEWDEETCSAAAQEGHLEVLQWARQNRCPWNARTCADAAMGGHLEVLQWARQNGCEWDKWTCSYAADGGHLEVLQWAHQNGCPWDEETWEHAQGNCRPYLLEHGCPGARHPTTT
jgi:hypothetical protein